MREGESVAACRLVCGIIAAASIALSASVPQPPVDPAPCTFPPAEITWLQRALDGWEQVSRQFLRIDAVAAAVDRPLRCVLRLASVS